MIEESRSTDAFVNTVSQSDDRRKSSREIAAVLDGVVFILLDEVQSKGLWYPLKIEQSGCFPTQNRVNRITGACAGLGWTWTAVWLTLGEKAVWKWLGLGATPTSGLESLRKRLCCNQLVSGTWNLYLRSGNKYRLWPNNHTSRNTIRNSCWCM